MPPCGLLLYCVQCCNYYSAADAGAKSIAAQAKTHLKHCRVIRSTTGKAGLL